MSPFSCLCFYNHLSFYCSAMSWLKGLFIKVQLIKKIQILPILCCKPSAVSLVIGLVLLHEFVLIYKLYNFYNKVLFLKYSPNRRKRNLKTIMGKNEGLVDSKSGFWPSFTSYFYHCPYFKAYQGLMCFCVYKWGNACLAFCFISQVCKQSQERLYIHLLFLSRRYLAPHGLPVRLTCVVQVSMLCEVLAFFFPLPTLARRAKKYFSLWKWKISFTYRPKFFKVFTEMWKKQYTLLYKKKVRRKIFSWLSERSKKNLSKLLQNFGE